MRGTVRGTLEVRPAHPKSARVVLVGFGSSKLARYFSTPGVLFVAVLIYCAHSAQQVTVNVSRYIYISYLAAHAHIYVGRQI